MELRPYQLEALRASKQALDEGVYRQIIVLPTGCGKTILLASLQKHHGLKKRLLVVVHREELAQQAADKIAHWNPEFNVGIEMGAKRSNSWDAVVVASVATIGRSGSSRIQQFNPDDFDCVIVDEVHHGLADSYQRVFDYFGLLAPDNKKLLLGVTATPNRSDGSPLAKTFDKIVYQMSIRDAIEQGWLCDLRGLRVNTTVDLEGVHTRAGDFDQGELSAAVNTPARNDLIVRNWLETANQRRTIAFTVDIQHAKDLVQVFKNYGVAAEAVWGDDPDRADKLRYHKAGQLQVLANCSVLTEGYDDPSVSCIVMARPTKSRLLFTQMVGRGTRLPEGTRNLKEALKASEQLSKTDCLVLDVADTTHRHSLVSVSSLFGLGQKTDLKGKSVIESAKMVEEAREENPQVDFSRLEDITKLKSFIEEVNLFEVKFPDEVIKYSKLQWYKINDRHYFIQIQKKERVDVVQDFLDRWGVVGVVDGNNFSEVNFKTLQEAFAYAEETIRIYGKQFLTLLRREAKWHKDAATEYQIRLLQKFKIPIPENLSKGDAQKMIGRVLSNRFSYKGRGVAAAAPA